MSHWCSINLGDAMLATPTINGIEDRFLSAYTEAGCPRDMALFIRHESEGRLHCQVKLFFSPAASSVASEVGAEACETPCAESLGLLIGAEDSWGRLFPV